MDELRTESKPKRRRESRVAVKVRVRKHRRKKEEEAQIAEQEREAQERLFSEMRQEGLTYFAEYAPTLNSRTSSEELICVREIGRALNIPDITIGELPRTYIALVMAAWIEAGCFAFDRKAQTFGKKSFDPPDVNAYVWLDGSDTPLTETPEPLPRQQL